MIEILLVDDHAVVRAGFKLLLSSVRGMHVCGEAERGEQAIQLYQSLLPDIVVMDLSMPGIGGLETIRRIMQRHTQAAILVFSVHHEAVYVEKALSAGAKGYITKNSAPEILPAAITCIVDGEQYIEQGLQTKLGGQGRQSVINAFSAREFDIFRLLVQGMTVYKIADELCLSHKTVANYATQIKKKLNVATTGELIQIGLSLQDSH